MDEDQAFFMHHKYKMQLIMREVAVRLRRGMA